MEPAQEAPRLETPLHRRVAFEAARIFGMEQTPEIRAGAYLFNSSRFEDDRHENGTICGGSYDEDYRDHLYGDLGLFSPAAHAWKADNGDLWPSWMGRPNAWEKAVDFWEGTGAEPPSYAAGVLRNYMAGYKSMAYEGLGHISHLLADMGVPAHAHADDHSILDDSYEEWMADTGIDSYGYKDAGTTIPIPWKKRLLSMDQAVFPLYYLMYTTNQYADYFASDDAGGNVRQRPDKAGWLDYSGWPESPVKAKDLRDNDCGNNDRDRDLSRIASKAYVYSIRATATLYRCFWETTHPRVFEVLASTSGSIGGLMKISARVAASVYAPIQKVEFEVRAVSESSWRYWGSGQWVSTIGEDQELWQISPNPQAGAETWQWRARAINYAGIPSEWVEARPAP